jgi:sugar/nucleoside kinase (ribokinase family)
MPDTSHDTPPLRDGQLMQVAETLLTHLEPVLLLITFGDPGILLCRGGQRPVHIPTAAREVFDISGAGDTLAAAFTLAVVAGASPYEVAMFSIHAARNCRWKTRHSDRAARGVVGEFSQQDQSAMNSGKRPHRSSP